MADTNALAPDSYNRLRDLMASETTGLGGKRGRGWQGPPALPAPFQYLPEVVNQTPAPSFLGSLFGATPATPVYGQATPDQRWPSLEDLSASRKYDLTYGTSVAPTLTEGAIVNRPSFEEVKKTYGKGVPLPLAPEEINSQNRDRLETSWLAANKTALGALGFDPRRISSTMDTGKRLTVGGFFTPGQDQIWTHEQKPSNVIHESLHRGINMLKEAGELPKWFRDSNEETFIRGMMLRHFGDIEVTPSLPGKDDTMVGNQAINYAKSLMNPDKGLGAQWRELKGKSFPDMLTELEMLAAERLKKIRPRGPA